MYFEFEIAWFRFDSAILDPDLDPNYISKNIFLALFHALLPVVYLE